jgi:hypothetical protein
MTKQKWILVLSILTIAVPLGFAAPVAAAEGHDCTGSPADAVLKLPLPLAKWGQIACTPTGHVLTSHDGWVWIMPDASRSVIIPSQMVKNEPEEMGNRSYFTNIDVAPVKGTEFDQAYAAFHVGFDEKEAKPDAYRVDLTSVSGNTMRMFFFDYDTYAWGISCPESKCDTGTRFMILDKNHRPEPRQPPI